MRAGVLTFLKTSTQLQIWFDDVLEFTWVYEDNDADNTCVMRKPMTGLKFRGPSILDTVSTHYRYQGGSRTRIVNDDGNLVISDITRLMSLLIELATAFNISNAHKE